MRGRHDHQAWPSSPFCGGLRVSRRPCAQNVGVAGAFSKGRTHFVVTAGTGYAFDETYLVLGLGANYYLIDGLNVGLHWSTGPARTRR